MDVSGETCPTCGSANIVDDELHCQSQRVCADCGCVLCEGALTNAPVGGSDVSYSRSTAIAKKPCVNLVQGARRVKAICRILRVNMEIEDLSLTYYSRVYQDSRFINASLSKKEILAGCCVLVSCRMLNWPLTMGTISCLLDADPMMVGVVYQEMIQILNIKAPIVNVTEVMEAHSQEYKLTPPHFPEELAEDSGELTRRAVALVELAADAWIVTGRRPVPIMMAAVYLAWQSLEPAKNRLKVSLDKFCLLAGVNKHPPALKRVTEMKEVLCKLGKEIPWVTEEVTPDNVLRQVGDILKHRSALLRRALKTHQDALRDGAEGSSKTPSSTAGGGSPSRDPRSDWGERALFCPPCVAKAKKRKPDRGELRDVTGDEEISDGEIDSYIRTPQEAREFALSQKMLRLSKKRKSKRSGWSSFLV